jgi:hypothetical protein
MDQSRLFRLLLSPSLSSGIITTLVTTAVLVSSSWLYISHNKLFYDYFFGAYGLTTTLIRLPDSSAVLWYWLSSNPITYYTLVVVTAIIAGLTVFTILQSVSRLIRESSLIWHELRDARERHKQAIREQFTRLAVRVAGLMVWAIYISLFFSVLVPFCIVTLQSGIDSIATGDLTGLLQVLGSAVMLWIGLHMHIVFARLVKLRPRLTGGIIDIELAELR